jgi:hypothetical protein
MNRITRFIAGAAVVVAGYSAVSAPAAFASTALPKISANTNGWHGQVRPNHVYIGQGNAPEVIALNWRWYRAQNAEARGLVLWPSASASLRNVRADFWRPIRHGAGSFFTRMNWTFRSTNGNLRTIHFAFVPESSTFPFWEQR